MILPDSIKIVDPHLMPEGKKKIKNPTEQTKKIQIGDQLPFLYLLNSLFCSCMRWSEGVRVSVCSAEVLQSVVE